MSLDRLKGWFVATVSKAVESLPYMGRYRYSVVSCDFDAQTLDLLPLDSGQPPLTKVAMRTPGLQIDIAPGTEVLVGYAGGSPTRPEVTSFGNDPASVLRVRVLGLTTPAAFQGMAVQVTIPAGSISIASAPGSGPPLPVTCDGVITGGSAVIFGG